MSTIEQQEELIEVIKHPIRHYNIRLWGYGGESAYIELTKTQYDFWKAHVDEHYDNDIINYMLNAEDGDYDFENIEFDDIPKEAHFMFDEDGDGSTWYEHFNELDHQWGVDFSCANIDIDEVDSEEYNATTVAEIVTNESLSEWTDSIMREDDYKTEITNMGCSEYEEWGGKYILQFLSSEKGTFFEGLVTTRGKLDPKKLMINTLEYANGDDTVSAIEYDGEEIDNGGGDTNGKGYSVHLFEG
jgi:hypothetical protein